MWIHSIYYIIYIFKFQNQLQYNWYRKYFHRSHIRKNHRPFNSFPDTLTNLMLPKSKWSNPNIRNFGGSRRYSPNINKTLTPLILWQVNYWLKKQKRSALQRWSQWKDDDVLQQGGLGKYRGGVFFFRSSQGSHYNFYLVQAHSNWIFSCTNIWLKHIISRTIKNISDTYIIKNILNITLLNWIVAST